MSEGNDIFFFSIFFILFSSFQDDRTDHFQQVDKNECIVHVPQYKHFTFFFTIFAFDSTGLPCEYLSIIKTSNEYSQENKK